MKDFTGIYEIIKKLRKIEPSSELEEAVIKNIIQTHLYNIHADKLKETNYEILKYDVKEVSKIKHDLNNKLGEV